MHVMHLSQRSHASGSALVTADLPNPLSHRLIPESFPSSQDLLAEIAVLRGCLLFISSWPVTLLFCFYIILPCAFGDYIFPDKPPCLYYRGKNAC